MVALWIGPLLACPSKPTAAKVTAAKPTAAEVTATSPQGSGGSGQSRAASVQRAGSPPPQRDEGLRYVVTNTAGAADGQTLPWVVALHGLGDRPESFASLFKRFPVPAHVYSFRAPRRYGRGFDWFGVRVSGDVDELSRAVASAAARVADSIRQLSEDPHNFGKPVVTGFSQGGILGFALAVHHAELLAHSVVVGGWLPEPLWPGALATERVGIRALHGEADHVVPWPPTSRAVQHLKRLGYPVEATTYAGLGHHFSPKLHADWVREIRSALARPRASTL